MCAQDPGSRCMPHALASEVPGIHNQPPDRAVVPPNFGSFSIIKNFQTMRGRGDSGAHAGCAGANYKDVAFISVLGSHFRYPSSYRSTRSAPAWIKRPRGSRRGTWRSPTMNSVACVIRVLPASDANPALREFDVLEPKLDDAVDRQFSRMSRACRAHATDRR